VDVAQGSDEWPTAVRLSQTVHHSTRRSRKICQRWCAICGSEGGSMTDVRDWKPEKPQCVHHNDADNCFSCCTARVSKGPNAAFKKVDTNEHRPSFCKTHNCATPCLECNFTAQIRIEQARNEVSLQQATAAAWADIVAKERFKNWPGGKCDHGHYLAKVYCNMCSIAAVDPGYDVNRYRAVINRALNRAKRLFSGMNRATVLAAQEIALRKNPYASVKLTEGQKNFENLESLVDIEIWKSSKSYGDLMSDALAYRIARTTANQFVSDIVDDQTMLASVAWEFLPNNIREAAKTLFQKVSRDLDALDRLTKDDRASREDRELAKKIVYEYGERETRSESMDVPTTFTDDTDGGDTTSRAEREFHAHERLVATAAPDVGDTFEAHRDDLLALVATWHGERRLVGEAMLRPGFTVRGVDGVSKSTASLLYQKVAAAFRAYIARSRK
jgi:hypothetical protein